MLRTRQTIPCSPGTCHQSKLIIKCCFYYHHWFPIVLPFFYRIFTISSPYLHLGSTKPIVSLYFLIILPFIFCWWVFWFRKRIEIPSLRCNPVASAVTHRTYKGGPNLNGIAHFRSISLWVFAVVPNRYFRFLSCFH